MPAWLLAILKFAVSYFGPTLLSMVKNALMKKYPEYAKVILDLIKDLTDPSKSNSAARKEAKNKCQGVGCPLEPL